MNKKVILLFGVVAVLVISLAGYAGAATNTPPTAVPTPETIDVTRCDVEQTVTAPGALRNISEMQLLMPVDGSLSEVLVRAGDSVTEGQVLARVNDAARVEAQIALKDAQAAYETAFNYRKSLEGKIWLDRITYRAGDRGQRIPIHHWYRGYADPSTIEDADHNLALKKAELDEAQATLATLTTDTGITIQATTWDAPRGGHHVEGALIFPATKDGKSILVGAGKITLTIINVDVPSRIFEWELK